MDAVELRTGGVVIRELESRDPEAVAFFSDVPADSRADLALRALALGVTGLSAVGVAGHAQVVEREFRELLRRFEETLGRVEGDVLRSVRETFDPERSESVSGRLSATIADAHGDAKRVVEGSSEELRRLIADSFNPDLSTSYTARIGALVRGTRADIDKAFDPSYDGSHLARLVALIDQYFGPDGCLAEQVKQEMEPAKKEVLEALQSLRDAVVGQAAADAQRQASPASGLDFEDRVEEVLRQLARAYGDTVERVGTEAGDAGHSRRGDFVVQLHEGPRFVVEAKKRSSALTLRGRRGLLAQLDESKLNRGAAFAVAVAEDERAFPREVGAFNEYDGDKLLCTIGPTGELLEVAYRWARAALKLTVARGSGIDVAAVEEAIADARKAAQELARVEAKAKAIVQYGDDIQAMVVQQLRQLNAALDTAATSLSPVEPTQGRGA